MRVEREQDRAAGLLICGLLLINDDCPPDRAAYLCRRGEDYDEEACARCWRKYLFAVSNEVYSPLMRREVYPPDMA